MGNGEQRVNARPSQLDIEEQVNDLLAQIKKKERSIKRFIWGIGVGVILTAIPIVIGIIFHSGFGGVAVLPGIITFAIAATFAQAYGEIEDEKSVLVARLRRIRVAAMDAGVEPASIREMRLGYRASLPGLIEDYRLQARKLRRIHNYLQVVVIVGSLSASALISLSRSFIWISFAAIVNTLVIGSAATISSYFKFKERSLTAQGAADSLEAELRAVDLRLAPYDRGTTDEILERLVATSERIRSEHKVQERQLDQISDVTYPVLNENTGPRRDLGQG